MKHVRHLLAGSPESAECAHLTSDVTPKRKRVRLHKPVGTVDRSREKRRLRTLSDKQKLLGDGMLQLAAERVREEAKNRTCKYLREFDTIYEHGYRTYQTRWDALADIVEPMLARLDIATMVLGWMDTKGQYHLNRQRGLAEDSTKTEEWTVSRTLTALEQAKYVRRKMRRIFKDGKVWITRVTIHIRPLFFIHLGLAHLLAPLRTKLRGKRDQLLAQAGKKAFARAQREATDAVDRKKSHEGAQRARRQAAQKQQAVDKDEYARRYNAALVAFALAHPELSGQLRAEAFSKAHPEYAIHPSALP